ncbi:MAG: alpha/beta hydrolase [bacterium]|nr:alpha/beta hydrolase [bacterium]MDE0287224.1 alpha/beta hydrolase [bacterium]MDE0439527.1 alpha/beta hydrolase [bacterium]
MAVLIHGGGWTGPFTRDVMDGMAVDLLAHGLATWNIEYRRIPPVGGWRDTLGDVAAGLDALEVLADHHPLDLADVTVIGHSAGGHLGFFAARIARRRPQRFVSLAGMLDLHSLRPDFDELLSGFMGDELDTGIHRVDPIRNLPMGIPIVAVHGDRDDAVSPDQSRRFAAAAAASGDRARLVEVAGADHHDLVDPTAPSWETVTECCLG